MPKIKTKEFYIAGKKQEYSIFYSEKDKFYIKDFDENVGGKYTSRKFGSTQTLEELIEKTRIAIKAYEEKIAELKKVIVLDLTASKSHLEKYANQDRHKGYKEPDYDPAWLGQIYSSDIFDGAVMGFYIEFAVKMFRKSGDQHEFYDIGGGGALINKSTIANLTMHQIIDWSQEREDALRKLHTMFDTLLDKFVTAMKTPELFIQNINNQKLLG